MGLEYFMSICRERKREKWYNKILLIIFGIFLSLVVLEVGLQAASFILAVNLAQQNRASFDDNEIRVLCIGESTTQLGGEDSYPFQLEEILNIKSADKYFKVINKGMSSKLSSDILSAVNDNLEKYKPHIVVAMIGVNDGLIGHEKALGFQLFLNKFRTYRLFVLLRHHLIKKYSNEVVPSLDYNLKEDESEDREDLVASERLLNGLMKIKLLEDSINKGLEETKDVGKRKKLIKALANYNMQKEVLLVAIGRHYRLRQKYAEAEKYLKTGIAENENNFGAYIELGRCHKDKGEYIQAVKLFKKSIQMNPETILGYAELGRTYRSLGWDNEVFDICQFFINKKLKNVWIYVEMGIWLKERGHYEQAEKVYLFAIKMNPGDSSAYVQLANVYQAQGMEDKANKYIEQGLLLRKRKQHYSSLTIQNYNMIVRRVLFKGIDLVCMQYPLRDIESLKNILQVRPTDQIIFVENKTNFEEKLNDGEYSKYFSDAFASDFGHCTRDGNRLIAENLADIIFKNFIKKTYVSEER